MWSCRLFPAAVAGSARSLWLGSGRLGGFARPGGRRGSVFVVGLGSDIGGAGVAGALPALFAGLPSGWGLCLPWLLNFQL